MGSSSIENINMYIEQAMKVENVQNYEIEVSGNSKKGDGYMGEVIFAKVFTKDADKKTYNFVIKLAKKSKELRDKTPAKNMYDRETYMYQTIIPTLKQVQIEKGDTNVFESTAKCYYASSENFNEFLILNNLKTDGYDLWDRNLPMNLNHVLMVMTQYGKWHSLSLAFQKSKPKVYEDLTKNMSNLLSEFVIKADMYESIENTFSNSLEILKEMGKAELVPKFQKIKNNIRHIFSMDRKFKACVISHGDAWNNNMMFKYKNNNKSEPIGMCFLDFQLSALVSPVYDLSYFLYSVSDSKILQNFDVILKTYHASLTESLQRLGYNSAEIFSFEDLLDHWKLYSDFGLCLCPQMLRILLSSQENVPDLTEYSESGDSISNAFNIKIHQEDAYKQRVFAVYSHYGENIL